MLKITLRDGRKSLGGHGPTSGPLGGENRFHTPKIWPKSTPNPPRDPTPRTKIALNNSPDRSEAATAPHFEATVHRNTLSGLRSPEIAPSTHFQPKLVWVHPKEGGGAGMCSADLGLRGGVRCVSGASGALQSVFWTLASKCGVVAPSEMPGKFSEQNRCGGSGREVESG